MRIEDLTSEEIALITELRQKKQAQEAFCLETQKILKVAAGYERWLYKHRRGSSLSTFVNEFGFDAPGAGVVYQIVQNIRDVAHKRITKDSL